MDWLGWVGVEVVWEWLTDSAREKWSYWGLALVYSPFLLLGSLITVAIFLD